MDGGAFPLKLNRSDLQSTPSGPVWSFRSDENRKKSMDPSLRDSRSVTIQK